jgi:hypothetical protein
MYLTARSRRRGMVSTWLGLAQYLVHSLQEWYKMVRFISTQQGLILKKGYESEPWRPRSVFIIKKKMLTF